MEAIRQARPSRLFLVQDGPRPDVPSDREACEAAREVAEAVNWPCQVKKLYATTNLGLRQRVTSGLDQVFSEVDSAIILEDDCVADSSFFPFADELLEQYVNDTRVGVISGNNFLRGRKVTSDSYFFSPDVRIWGWATWARVWKDFSAEGLRHEWTEHEAREAVASLPSASRRRAIVRMASQAHTLNSWALPFVLHAQKRGYLSAVPEKNLVTNVGFGAGSTHTRFESFTDEVPLETLEFPLDHPDSVEANREAGRLETALHRRMWWTFPLRHPIDFLGRVIRYFTR